ncbi:MAG: ORF6N domain-containing protein [Deltaproteobacteria bacterium]|nr:MAG: ORF6N domain-containing protein [Deltaproteobacteria bacterium]
MRRRSKFPDVLIRGQKVTLDTDLAELYRIPTKALNQAMKRNKERFPGEFVFQLTNFRGLCIRFSEHSSLLS